MGKEAQKVGEIDDPIPSSNKEEKENDKTSPNIEKIQASMAEAMHIIRTGNSNASQSAILPKLIVHATLLHPTRLHTH